VLRSFEGLPKTADPLADRPPRVVPQVLIRNKELEQSHVCLGTSGYQQDHEDRYSSYVLNTVLGGSMSSRLFQNVREKRGLAYAVFSGLSAYRDAGSVTIYAGCANHAVSELIDVVIAELRRLKDEPIPGSELRRAKDHLKGSLMLNLESTSSRMSHIARQEIYFDRQFGLDETLEGVERVSCEDVQRVARDLFMDGALAATVLGAVNGLRLPPERLALGNGSHLERPPEVRDLAAGGIGSRRRHGARWHHPGGRGAGDQRARPVRHRADRGNRAGHPARRDRLYHRGRRACRSRRPVAPFRSDLF
jgi:secreted Zn-dependent insulinase-like peptidase